MNFQNEYRNYPIRGIPDDVPGVAYRTGPKGWMDKQVMVQYLKERRVIYPDSGGHQRMLFMDNCGGHNESPEQQSALQQLNAVIRKIPKYQHICASLVTHGSYKRSCRCGQRSGGWKNFV